MKLFKNISRSCGELLSPNGEFENVRQFRKGDRGVIQDRVSKWWNLQSIVINEPKFRNYNMETEGQYHRNQKFLNLLPNPNPVIAIEPTMVILRITIKPDVKSWIAKAICVGKSAAKTLQQ
jgi:hypothetical protein